MIDPDRTDTFAVAATRGGPIEVPGFIQPQQKRI
jgi:hypothetical protein